DAGPVGERRLPELGLVRVKDATEVANRPGSGESQLLDGAGQGAGKAGLSGDGIELSQTTAELMDHPRAHRFDAERRQRREAARGHRLRRDREIGRASCREREWT